MSSESICYGTTSKGKLEYGCKLPSEGDNFFAYSSLGVMLGRTYVHCMVADVIKKAYADLHEQYPRTVFMYGETGWASGGSFKPHKTHQNGLSVDFMVPVLDKAGKSVPLQANALNKYGYDIEFDADGKYKELAIDFEAIAAHLSALKKAAESKNVKIWRVIFDPELQPFLQKTKAWPAIKDQLEFSKRKSWVRHDDHYHVDFSVSCQPLS
jgi:penicillin-insensitive murein endopeptidase